MHQSSFAILSAPVVDLGVVSLVVPPAMINGGIVVGLVLLGASSIVYVENRVVIGETAHVVATGMSSIRDCC